MLRIGITGGIGSGKSTVARMFNVLGIPVYDADSASKRLMNEEGMLKQQIIEAFGKETYQDGILNRKYLAAQVFNYTTQLELLNSLVHPATIKDADEWMHRQNAPYILKEAALIFESKSYLQLDFVIGVSCPEELRIQRTMERDGISYEKVKARMNQQMDEEEKMRLCQYVILNDEKNSVISQVLQLHNTFLKK